MPDPGLSRLLDAMDAMAQWTAGHAEDVCGDLSPDRAALRLQCLRQRLGSVADASAYVGRLAERADTGRCRS